MSTNFLQKALIVVLVFPVIAQLVSLPLTALGAVVFRGSEGFWVSASDIALVVIAYACSFGFCREIWPSRPEGQPPRDSSEVPK